MTTENQLKTNTGFMGYSKPLNPLNQREADLKGWSHFETDSLFRMISVKADLQRLNDSICVEINCS